jgi:hypothetical protein
VPERLNFCIPLPLSAKDFSPGDVILVTGWLRKRVLPFGFVHTRILVEVWPAPRLPFKLFVLLPAIAVATIATAPLTRTVAAANEMRDETSSFESRFSEQRLDRAEQPPRSSPQLRVLGRYIRPDTQVDRPGD